MASTGCQKGKQTPAESYDPNDYEHVVSKRPVADSTVRKTIAEDIVGKTKLDQFLKDADFELEKLLASKTHAITTKRGWLVELLSVGIESLFEKCVKSGNQAKRRSWIRIIAIKMKAATLCSVAS